MIAPLGGICSFAKASLQPDVCDDLVILQYNRLQAQLPTLYPALIIAIIIGATALPSTLPPLMQVAIPGLFVGTCIFWLLRWYQRRGIDYDVAMATRELRHTARKTVGFGIAIAMWSTMILLDTHGSRHTFIPVLIMTAASIAAHCMASIPRTAISMIVLTTTPTIGLLFVSSDPGLMMMGAAVFLTSLIHCRLVMEYYRQMVATLVVNHEMSDQANTDDLTSLPNRRAFNAMFDAEVKRCQSIQKFGIAMIDLDGFKQVNDEWGHSMGDALLRAVADRLDKCRLAHDTVFRFGGDEFAVIFRGIVSQTDIAARATALLGALAAPDDDGIVAVRIGASLGYAQFPIDGQNLRALLSAADKALYSAKREGKGRAKGFAGADVTELALPVIRARR